MGSSGVDLAPYRSNLVSLPANVDGSPKLSNLSPPEVRVFFLGRGGVANMSFCEG